MTQHSRCTNQTCGRLDENRDSRDTVLVTCAGRCWLFDEKEKQIWI